MSFYRGIFSFIAMAGVGVGSAAIACAPTPQAAAEQFLESRARCDFVTAWGLLARSEREAFRDVAYWSQYQLLEAVEDLGCRSVVEEVSVSEETAEPERIATVRFVIAEPLAVLEFRRLRDEREYAPFPERERLDRLISETRGRLLQTNHWEPRARHAAGTTVVWDSSDGRERWCVRDGYALRAARAQEEMERRRVESEQASQALREQMDRDAEQRRLAADRDVVARRRGDAVLSQISIAAVRVGQTVLREPGIWGEVVNSSSETLRRVELRVEYLDGTGRVVGETTFTPIMPSAAFGLGLSQASSPLPPGQRRPFGLRADDAPSVWARRVRVYAIRAEVDPDASPIAQAPPATHQRPAAQRQGNAVSPPSR